MQELLGVYVTLLAVELAVAEDGISQILNSGMSVIMGFPRAVLLRKRE